MRPRDVNDYNRLADALGSYERTHGPLPGIVDSASRTALLRQMVDSIHRIRYTAVIRSRRLSPEVISPDSVAFDPIKAAVYFQRAGDLDEAFWMVFLFVHFGRHLRGGWRYLKEVYAGDGENSRWTWQNVTANPDAFRDWLREHSSHIARKNEPGGFGNHRKYESLDADKANGTAAVVASYVKWIDPPRTHSEFVDATLATVGNDPREGFSALYESMGAVHRFGRTARFDYLAMLGKLGLATIIPDKAYLRDATGPRKGAQLLLAGNDGIRLGHAVLEERLRQLDAQLQVGMQVLEDSLCNWQKAPQRYLPFRG